MWTSILVGWVIFIFHLNNPPLRNLENLHPPCHLYDIFMHVGVLITLHFTRKVFKQGSGTSIVEASRCDGGCLQDRSGGTGVVVAANEPKGCEGGNCLAPSDLTRP